MSERKVTTILVIPTFQHLRKVGVYCRVSSTRTDQLSSMSAQASHLTKTALNCRSWQLVDIYLDFRSGLDDNRPELQRLIKDCKDGIIDTILTKSVSRFDRNTAETISLLRELSAIGVRVIFENEEIDTSKYESEFLINLIEAFAQEESYNRSENILWGIEKGMKDGTSKLYNRSCFGYRKNENGDLEIFPEETKIVRLIFDLYLQGNSIFSIINELEGKEILTPSGKKNWCNQTVVKILTDKKYIGNVLLKKTYTDGFPNRKRKKNSGEKHQYLAERIHPEIISKEMFDAVKEERQRRSNVVIDENSVKQRASKRYSSKTVNIERESNINKGAKKDESEKF